MKNHRQTDRVADGSTDHDKEFGYNKECLHEPYRLVLQIHCVTLVILTLPPTNQFGLRMPKHERAVIG
jgi:hypothetical protein